MSSSSSGQPGDKPPVIVKKYANRRLYNTATSSYVTLEDLAVMIKEGGDFVVYDAKSGDDITRSVLTQIIVEQEQKGHNLLPISFLRQLIGFYGDSMQFLDPGAQLDFPRPGAARLAVELEIALRDRIGIEQAVGAALVGARVARLGDAAVDDDVADMDVVRLQLAREALRQAAQRKLAHR